MQGMAKKKTNKTIRKGTLPKKGNMKKKEEENNIEKSILASKIVKNIKP
jgi:hypothetical protein